MTSRCCESGRDDDRWIPGWQAMGHQVRRGEKAIKILGPVTRKVGPAALTGKPIRDADGLSTSCGWSECGR